MTKLAITGFSPDRVRRYREAGLWGERTLAEELHRAAAHHGAREALVTAHGRLSYAELDERSDLAAASLLDLGLEPSDRVLLQLANTLELGVAWYAVLKAGLIPVCTLPVHRRHEVGQIAGQTLPRAHFVQADLANGELVALAQQIARDTPGLEHLITVGGSEQTPGTRLETLTSGDAEAARRTVERVQARIDPDDVVVFQLSGGTTNIPKVIPRLHAEYWYNARRYGEALTWDENVRVAHVIPVVHNAGVVCALHAAAACGASCIIGTSDPEALGALVRRERPTDMIIGLPHVHAMLAHEQLRSAMSSVERFVFAGSHLPLELGRKLESHGLRVLQLFGTGEGLFLLTPPGASEEMRLTTVGLPLSSHDEVRILRPGTEEQVAPGEEGELCCRGPYTINAYYGADEHNLVAFTSDGFYRTGDVARQHEIDGQVCYSIEGRIKDVINRGAEKINAAEVEEILTQHPGIADAAVVAMPDERLGERACAFLVAASDTPLDLPAVQAFLEQRGLAKFKWPERLEWVDVLPMTALGKSVDKKLLRERIAQTLAEARANTGVA